MQFIFILCVILGMVFAPALMLIISTKYIALIVIAAIVLLYIQPHPRRVY